MVRHSRRNKHSKKNRSMRGGAYTGEPGTSSQGSEEPESEESEEPVAAAAAGEPVAAAAGPGFLENIGSSLTGIFYSNPSNPSTGWGASLSNLFNPSEPQQGGKKRRKKRGGSLAAYNKYTVAQNAAQVTGLKTAEPTYMISSSLTDSLNGGRKRRTKSRKSRKSRKSKKSRKSRK